MTDVVSAETRRRMMSGIRTRDTTPEIVIRSQMHKLGFRFRIHDKKLPGKPDIVLKKYQAVVFVHGCFWHRHECHLFKWPKTRPQFWKKKINRNHEKDLEAIEKLTSLGWRICIVWECAIKGAKRDVPSVVASVSKWLSGEEKMLEIEG